MGHGVWIVTLKWLFLFITKRCINENCYGIIFPFLGGGVEFPCVNLSALLGL